MKNTFATLPPAAMWALAALLGLPALFDIASAIAQHRPTGIFFAIGPLAMALFLAWCAWQRRAGRVARLASPRVTLAGYLCFGLFAGSFLVRIATQGSHLFG